MRYIKQLDKITFNVDVNLWRKIVTALYSVAALQPYSSFPKFKFISFFPRCRVYYLFKVYNAEKNLLYPLNLALQQLQKKKYKKIKIS